MWFGTNRITMLKDLPFKHMRSGNWIVSSKNVRRSLFVKRHDASGTYGVYMVDYERTLSGTNLCGGTARNVQFTTGSPPPLTPTVDEFDCAGYKLDGTMTRATVTDMATAGSSATYANSNWSVAPILVRWTGGNIGFQMQPDQPEFKDFFRQKQVTNAAAYVELISGTYSPTFAQSWCAQVYEGTSDTAIYTATPVNQSGTKVSTVSYVGNEMPRAPFGQHGVMGASLSPSFVFPVCGVEIKLLAFSLTGRILDTQRRRV